MTLWQKTLATEVIHRMFQQLSLRKQQHQTGAVALELPDTATYKLWLFAYN